MTQKFATFFFGRIFMHPQAVFDDSMLRPELQDLDVFANSVDTIVATHQRVAKAYIADGTISYAVPPIRALLEIMAERKARSATATDTAEATPTADVPAAAAALPAPDPLSSREAIAKAGELGFCGLYAPESIGGLALPRLDATLVFEVELLDIL